VCLVGVCVGCVCRGWVGGVGGWGVVVVCVCSVCV
jgi:hypothetical protein